MTTIQHPVADRHNERGVALLSVLLLMVLISALSGALVISGRTELLLARNHQAAAQAEAAAEAGLNHAMQVTLAKLLTWKSDGFGSIGLAATALLVGPDGLTGSVATDADNGSLATYGIPDAGITLTGVLNSSYQVRLMDEDDPARGTVPSNITVAPVSEDNNPYADLNGRILVRSTGVARDNTTVTLEAMIGPADPPAIVTNCDLTISGNVDVLGSGGGVHSNCDLSVGGSAWIDQDATASGTASNPGHNGGIMAGGQPMMPIPPIHAIDYLWDADYILDSTGQVLSQDPVTHVQTVVCAGGTCTAAYGWSFGGGTWNLNDANASGSTYYVEGEVRKSGNMTLTITIIAEGSIDFSGNGTILPDTPGLLIVTDGDLDVTGGTDFGTPGNEGRILVREQMRLRGNTSIYGQIMVEDIPSGSMLLTETTIFGNVTVTYNGSLGAITSTATGWREVR